MGSHSAVMMCVVCGARLPVLPSRQEYVDRGCGIQLPDGSYRFFCAGNRHSTQEIDEALHGLPTFTTGSVLKNKQKLI
jgi:hypothetical protein